MTFKSFSLPLILLVLGALLILVGGLFKIIHWPFAQEVLIFGMGVDVAALILILLKLYRKK